MFGRCLQPLIISVHIGDVHNAADDISDGGNCKAEGQTGGFLQKSHQQRADADAHIVGEHIGGIGHTPLGRRSGPGYKGLEQGLQNSVPEAEEKSGRKQVYAGVHKQITDHGHDQKDKTDIHQDAVATGVNHLLGGQLGNQHSGDQENVEVRQKCAQSFFLGEDGGVGNHGAIWNHKKHHVEHKRKCRSVNGIAQRKLFPGGFGVADAAAGNADQRRHRDPKDGHKGSLAVHMALNL